MSSETKKVEITNCEYKVIKNILAFYKHTFQEKDKEMFIRDFINARVKLSNYMESVIKRFTLDEIITITYTNNYKLVYTPEENLVDYYKELQCSPYCFNKDKAEVVLEVLNILELKIKGIN